MNASILRHVLRQNRLRLLTVVAALTAWGMLMPIVYATFGVQLRDLVEQFPAMQQFMRFGGGDMFTLPGSIAVGYIHPIAIALLAVFAIAFPLSGVAGERQRGTLEIVLARPVSRRSYYLTLLVAVMLFISLAVAATLVGTVIAAGAVNVLDELQLANMPLLWLNGVLLYFAIAAICFAASVSFDRMGPAAGIAGAANLIRYRAKIEDPKDAVVMLSTLAVGLASGVGLWGLAIFSTVFIVIAVGLLESFEPEAYKLFDLKIKAKDATAIRPRVQLILRRNKVRYELRSAGDDEIVYETKVPTGRKTDGITEAIHAIDAANEVEWDEKKAK